MTEREDLVRKHTEELKQLLESNTDLKRQDKELTQRVAELTRETHAAVKGG